MNRYQQTIQIYREQWKEFIKILAHVSPKELPIFAKLIKRNGRVLDVGSAGGRDAKRFVKFGLHVVGIDVVDEFLREARRSVPQAKFIKMDVRRLKFPKNYFDAVWANAVLLHFDKRTAGKVVKLFYKVLRPAGKLAVGVKMGKGHSFTTDGNSPSRSRFFSYWSQVELERMLKKSGFKIIRSKISPDMRRRKNVKWVKVWGEKS